MNHLLQYRHPAAPKRSYSGQLAGFERSENPVEEAALDRVYQALSDPTRRAILDRLSRGPASVGQLAAPLPITLTAVGQHLKVLEASGLVSTSKSGRVRTCRADPKAISAAEAWLTERRHAAERAFDRLEALLNEPE